MSGRILVVNAGSSSVKVELFGPDLVPELSGSVTEIGGSGQLVLGQARRPVSAPDHAAALGLLLADLSDRGCGPGDLDAAGHRVVHGGAELTAPCRIDAEVMAGIEACIPLAPLHNPHNLSAIRALAAAAPGLPQCASFDTAFHATNPEVATTYALPEPARALGLRRYGFHGLSYAGLVEALDPLPDRLLALHLGNGASLCAIRDGRSVATSMGYSPLSGTTMGTRTGEIDGNAVLRLVEVFGQDEAARLLNRESGLRGLAGASDMAALLARDDAAARFAVDHFCYWAVRQAGSLIAAMEGLDAIAFTGGIGENADTVRDRIVAGLRWAGEVPVHVVPADEEGRIARDTARVLAA
ncbi:acetate kinase [Mesobaculum littorinae]|uniref:Acetate kinase n=1 Tax=Mesobaculum littorinae TaxID=2486419 RepID=A0A438AJ70_9RHOB|nr:acetate/propionate family kinase [Mesobaculum littorinae]RVV98709.1 acetate kinase [Mesobaculum littorinae]